MKRARIESPGGCFFVLHVLFRHIFLPQGFELRAGSCGSANAVRAPYPGGASHDEIQWVPVQRFHKEWKMKMNDGDFLKVVVS